MGKSTKRRASPGRTSRGITVAEGAGLLAQSLRREIEHLTHPETRLTNTARQQQTRRCVDALQKLGELTGEQLTERELLRHPRFQAAVSVIRKALEPWPQAMASVGEALKRVDETGRGE
jgi:hypothetical protein